MPCFHLSLLHKSLVAKTTIGSAIAQREIPLLGPAPSKPSSLGPAPCSGQLPVHHPEWAYLSEREDDSAAALLLAGETDVSVGGEQAPSSVAAAEGCPQGAVPDGVQPLLPRQPEDSPEQLTLRSGFQVPGEVEGMTEGEQCLSLPHH